MKMETDWDSDTHSNSKEKGKKVWERKERDTVGDGVWERERERETGGETTSQTEDYHGIPPREQSCS